MSGGFLLGRIALSSLKSRLTAPNTASNSQNFISVRSFTVTRSKNMKIVQFKSNQHPEEIRVGYVEGECVVDINKAASTIPSTLLGIMRQDALEKVKALKSTNPASIPLKDVKLVAPITGMDKVLCIGLNYKDHCEEQNLKLPAVPMIFGKFPSTVIGPSEAVKLRTDVTEKVDWEVELVVVIGKTASNVKAADAHKYIMGYTVGQDISARDWQKEKNMGQFLLGKAMDTFCPIGPWVTTSDEIADPQNLEISCCLNGELKQKSNTSQLIHKIPDVIERISSALTLMPGDIILTGTPGGVGMHRSPPEYLCPGDVIRSEISCIGVLETRVEKF